MNMKDIPIISLGSPKGIGYEIFLMTVKQRFFTHIPVCVGSGAFLKKVLGFFKNYTFRYEFCDYKNIAALPQRYGSLDCEFVLIDIDKTFDSAVPDTNIADISDECDGKVALNTIQASADLVKDGYFGSVVTLAVSKKHINIFDESFVGHTEFYQKQWNEPTVFMTFVADDIRIILLTTHLPLTEVSNAVTKEVVRNGLKAAGDLLDRLGEKRDICFCGLNPHAGEEGLLGTEELWMRDIIDEYNRNSKIKSTYPIPADTAFIPANRKKYGAYICSYHDQGLIPFKMLAFDKGVNLSFGMKYIRTSVDHGTGVDLIGTLSANNESFKAAYNLAIALTK